jgi:hypothetical protein
MRADDKAARLGLTRGDVSQPPSGGSAPASSSRRRRLNADSGRAPGRARPVLAAKQQHCAVSKTVVGGPPRVRIPPPPLTTSRGIFRRSCGHGERAARGGRAALCSRVGEAPAGRPSRQCPRAMNRCSRGEQCESWVGLAVLSQRLIRASRNARTAVNARGAAHCSGAGMRRMQSRSRPSRRRAGDRVARLLRLARRVRLDERGLPDVRGALDPRLRASATVGRGLSG